MFYPDDYNGCWSSCPDPITFEAFATVNIYEESNAYVYDSFWKKTERPEQRDEAGNEIFPGSDLKYINSERKRETWRGFVVLWHTLCEEQILKSH